ncbi:MAG: filamentous hemagglutinin N-terminal domain-containing protein, partial [Betaproteobacteria bacterium]|nr:filamentous hemagglutinin N-terminal domain-containing protein [Betaproteobacteria bacterium]
MKKTRTKPSSCGVRPHRQTAGLAELSIRSDGHAPAPPTVRPGSALPATLIALGLIFASSALALPQGGQIVAGQGSLSQKPGTLTINQGSQNLILNWQSFGIGSTESVRFNQPSPSAIALNRIVGSDPSQVFGQLSANGQIYLVNPNGILFAPSAQVSVGGLVASTLDISNADFLAGKRTFSGNGSTGSVLNQGRLQAADAGYIALLGGQVSNQGTITARLGTVALGAGNQITLDFAGNQLTRLQVDQGVLKALAQNGQLIQADGGTVIMTAQAVNALLGTVVNNSGVIQAQGVSRHNGRILLDGGSSGVVTNVGTLDASNPSGTGGSVSVLGNQLQLAASTRVDASGTLGGGTVLVGGNAHGAGPERDATHTAVAAGAQLKADATQNGNGGSVVVWADGNTVFDGTVSARGGAFSGNGGFVETSGKSGLSVGEAATVDTLAPRGPAGTWLLDPATITVGSSGTGTLAQAAATSDTSTALTINASTLNAATSNVILAASQAITVSSAIGMTKSGVGITFEGAPTPGSGPSGGTTLNANITTTKGGLTFDGNTILGAGITLNTGSGNITFNGSVDGNAALAITSTGTTTFGGAVGSATALTNLSVSGGTTVLKGNVNTSGAQSYGGAVTLNGDATLSAGSGNLTFNGAVNDANAAGTDSLTVTTSGTTQFSSTVGASKALAGLAVSGATVLKGNVTTSGTQSYGGSLAVNATSTLKTTNSAITVTGPTTLGGNTTVNSGSGNVTFDGTVDGARTLAITSTGTTTFNAAIGSSTALSGLTVSGTAGTTLVGGNVTTTGAQTYGGSLNVNAASMLTTTNGAVTVTGATTLGGDTTVSTGSGAVTFTGTVDGTLAGADNLTVTSNGTTKFGSMVGATTALASLVLNGTGADQLGGNVTTTGAQSYGGAVTLNGDATLSAGSGNLTFNGAVNGKHALSLNTTGTTTLGGAVGNTATLSSLAVSGDAILNGNVSTSLAQSYGGAVTLNSNATLSAGSSAVTFGSTVDGANSLTINSTGTTSFGGPVGDSTALSSLAVNGTAGTTILGGNVTTTGAQSYGGKLSLNSSVLISAGTGAVTFTGTVNDASAGVDSLTVTTSGITKFGSTVGATNALASLVLNGTGADQLGGNVTTTGIQSYGGAMTLNGNALLSAGSSAVTFSSTVDGARILAVTTSGATTFGDAVGNTTALSSLAVSGGGTTTINGNVSTSGTQTYGGTLVVNDPATLKTGSKAFSVAGSTTLNGDTSVTTGSGAVTFTGSVDGNAALAITSTGTTTFGGTVGSATALTNLSVSGGTTVLNGNVNTSGAQSYGGAVTLGNSATLNAGSGNVTFNNTVNDANATGTDSLTVTTSGTTQFNSTVGASKALAGLTVNSGSTTLKGNLSVNGPIDFSSGVTLGNNVTVTEGAASSVVFGGTIDDSVAGAHSLTISAPTGTLSLGGAIGSAVALGTLSITTGNAGTLALPDISAANLNFTDTVSGGNLGQSGSLNITGTATLISGSNDISLNSSANALATVRVVSGGNVTVVNSGAMKVTGVGASGNVLLDTLTGNLTVAGNISTTAVTATALKIEASSSSNRVATPGASDTGGNVLVSGGRLSVGSGGIGAIYTGSISNSTGVASAAGTGHSRYWSDTNGNTGYTTALATGINAIFREQPVLTVSASATGSGRTYNATTSTPSLSTTGLVNRDTGAGTGTITITGSGSTLQDAGNYTLSVSNAGAGAALGGLGYAAQAGADSTYVIIPKPLSFTGITAPASKVYDGTTSATVSGTAALHPAESAGAGSATDGRPYTGDAVSVSGATTGTYNSKDVANATTVTFGGLSLSGAQAGNYTLASDTVHATIKPATLTVNDTTVASKVYDGTTAAALSGGSLAGVIGSDAVTLTQAGSFASKNVGNTIAVSAADTLSGTDAGNYTLTQPTGLSASITPKALNVTGLTLPASKVYDGSTAASVSGTASLLAAETAGTGSPADGKPYAGDALNISGTASGTYNSKNVANATTVTFGGLSLSGAQAMDYVLNLATTTASITPASLSVTGTTVASKVYDGTTTAALSGGSLAGVIGSDAVTLAQAGSFASKNVGNAITVSAADTLSGTDAGNYTLTQPTGLSASITPKPITV